MYLKHPQLIYTILAHHISSVSFRIQRWALFSSVMQNEVATPNEQEPFSYQQITLYCLIFTVKTIKTIITKKLMFFLGHMAFMSEMQYVCVLCFRLSVALRIRNAVVICRIPIAQIPLQRLLRNFLVTDVRSSTYGGGFWCRRQVRDKSCGVVPWRSNGIWETTQDSTDFSCFAVYA